MISDNTDNCKLLIRFVKYSGGVKYLGGVGRLVIYLIVVRALFSSFTFYKTLMQYALVAALTHQGQVCVRQSQVEA